MRTQASPITTSILQSEDVHWAALAIGDASAESQARTMGTNIVDPSSPPAVPAASSRRHRNTMLAFSRWAMATWETEAPGTEAAATICRLNSDE
jgi:hypothetical protein